MAWCLVVTGSGALSPGRARRRRGASSGRRRGGPRSPLLDRVRAPVDDRIRVGGPLRPARAPSASGRRSTAAHRGRARRRHRSGRRLGGPAPRNLTMRRGGRRRARLASAVPPWRPSAHCSHPRPLPGPKVPGHGGRRPLGRGARVGWQTSASGGCGCRCHPRSGRSGGARVVQRAPRCGARGGAGWARSRGRQRGRRAMVCRGSRGGGRHPGGCRRGEAQGNHGDQAPEHHEVGDRGQPERPGETSDSFDLMGHRRARTVR